MDMERLRIVTILFFLSDVQSDKQTERIRIVLGGINED